MLVSHPNTQYVHRLLLALFEIHELEQFYTSVHYSDKKFPGSLINKLPSAVVGKLYSILKRRDFSGIPDELITHFPLLELNREIQRRIFSVHQDKAYLKMCHEFDVRVSRELKGRKGSKVISYEMACENTFKTVREQGGTSILDLAQIHYNGIYKIASTYPGFKYLIKDKVLLKEVNDRKERELQLSDHIFCLSSFAKKSLIDEGYDESRVHTVNLGFSYRLFSPKESYAQQEVLKLLFVGTITRRKGVDQLLKVVKRLNETSKKVELTMVGPMGDAKELLVDLSKDITLIPFTNPEGLSSLYQNADLFVFPSYLDSWAMVVIEAMASGTPVIVSDNTGSKDAVQQGGGRVLETGNEEMLFATISEYYHNRELIRIDGEKAAETAKRFTWDNYNAQIKELSQNIF